MRITALLCNYNGDAYLAEAIQSLLQQTRAAEEIVIVDDGSTDESLQIISQKNSGHAGRIKLVKHDANRGQAAAFNSGVAHSTGDIVCFLDSDDEWFPDKLAIVEEAVTGHEHFGLMQHNLLIKGKDKPTHNLVMPAMSNGDVFSQWMQFKTFPNFAPTSGLTIPRSVFHKIAPIPEALRISADSYMTRAATSQGPLISQMDPLGYYRAHDNNEVFNNKLHDSWAFFKRSVAPELAKFYFEQGLPIPDHIESAVMRVRHGSGITFQPLVARSIKDRLLDLSLRKIGRQVFSPSHQRDS